MVPVWTGYLLLPNLSRPPSFILARVAPDGHLTAMETMLINSGQRLRDVRVAPDGSIYLLTDETNGAVLRLTRAPDLPATPAPGAPRPRPAGAAGG